MAEDWAKRILRGYLIVGVVFGTVEFLSYIYAAGFIIWTGGVHGLLDSAAPLGLGIGASLLRVLFWLPLLILWAMHPGNTSILDFLAPGWGTEVMR